MYSALRYQGKRMYQLAREGIEVERQPRTVTIEKLVLTGRGPDWLELDVTCTAGTYIRSLAADISEKLDTVGHLAALTRTETDGWTIEAARGLEDLRKHQLPEAVIPLEVVLARFARVDVDDQIGLRLQQGQRLSSAELHSLDLDSPEHNKVVWFRPPAGRPLILAQVAGEPAGPQLRMEILRVLLPTQQSVDFTKENT